MAAKSSSKKAPRAQAPRSGQEVAPRKRSSAPKKQAQKPVSEADKVRATAAAPHASRVESENVHQSADTPLTIYVLGGARAKLEVINHEPLTQAQLQTTVKLLNAAIQETY
jgi:hypothetical protein